jgi:hypothetical protein
MRDEKGWGFHQDFHHQIWPMTALVFEGSGVSLGCGVNRDPLINMLMSRFYR